MDIEYKVGDYVYVIEGISTDSKTFVNKIKKVISIREFWSISIEGGIGGLWAKGSGRPQEFRKPTIQELKDSGLFNNKNIYELWI